MKKRLALLLICIFVLLALSLYACDKPLPKVDYALDNDFSVNIEDGEDALVFSPIGVTPTIGLLFYVGTFIDASNYEYLGKALAKQGYLAVFPKVMFAFFQYDDYEPAYNRFKGVRFFLGGHSQGGGAAIRRAQENSDVTDGLILLAPLCYKYNNSVFNGGGDPDNIDFYNVAELALPSLILHAADDRVLSDGQKSAVFECVNAEYCEKHVITPGAHMSFSTADSDAALKMFNNDGDGISEQEKQAQRETTVKLVLAFMKRSAQ